VTGLVAVVVLVVAAVVAVLVVRPAAERTGLGIWHPAMGWLALTGVFFAIGSVVLALRDGRPAAALFVAGCATAFAAGVFMSDRFARSRGAEPALSARGLGPARASALGPAPDPAPVRPIRALVLGLLALLAIAPTLARVGIPFLATDITDARSELTGLPVQFLRVAFPAFGVAAMLVASGRRWPSQRFVAFLAIAAILVFELMLASRYLAAELVAALLIALALAGRRLPLRAMAGLAVASLILFAGIQVVRAYEQAVGRELAFAVERTVNRVLLIQPRTLDALQVVIPAEQPYFGGLTWARRVAPLVGRDDVPNLGYWIYPRLFPEQDPPGYAAPGIIGESWANFGPLGVGLLAAFGAVVERFGALVARRRVGTADIVAGALVILFVARTHALGVNGLIVLLVLVLAWRLLASHPSGLLADAREVLRWRV
jgi:hypothetical protein